MSYTLEIFIGVAILIIALVISMTRLLNKNKKIGTKIETMPSADKLLCLFPTPNTNAIYTIISEQTGQYKFAPNKVFKLLPDDIKTGENGEPLQDPHRLDTLAVPYGFTYTIPRGEISSRNITIAFPSDTRQIPECIKDTKLGNILKYVCAMTEIDNTVQELRETNKDEYNKLISQVSVHGLSAPIFDNFYNLVKESMKLIPENKKDKNP